MITDILSALGAPIITAIAVCLLALVFSSYIKISTILGILKLGFGFNSLPSSFVTGALALVLSYFVMYPYLKDANQLFLEASTNTKTAEEVEQKKQLAFNQVADKWKIFLENNAAKEEVDRFKMLAVKLDKLSPKEVVENSWRILAPAFIISELKAAFKTGLNLLLPFLIVDLLIALVLSAIDFNRLSPSLISLPFKLLIFILLDGWSLITSNIILTYS